MAVVVSENIAACGVKEADHEGTAGVTHSEAIEAFIQERHELTGKFTPRGQWSTMGLLVEVAVSLADFFPKQIVNTTWRAEGYAFPRRDLDVEAWLVEEALQSDYNAARDGTESPAPPLVDSIIVHALSLCGQDAHLDTLTENLRSFLDRREVKKDPCLHENPMADLPIECKVYIMHTLFAHAYHNAGAAKTEPTPIGLDVNGREYFKSFTREEHRIYVRTPRKEPMKSAFGEDVLPTKPWGELYKSVLERESEYEWRLATEGRKLWTAFIDLLTKHSGASTELIAELKKNNYKKSWRSKDGAVISPRPKRVYYAWKA